MKTSPVRYKKSPKSIVGSEPVKDKDITSLNNHMKAYSDKEGEKSKFQKKIMWPENPLKPKPKERRQGQVIDFLKE